MLMATQSAKNLKVLQLLSVLNNLLGGEVKEINCEQQREAMIARRYEDTNESKGVQE